MSDYPRAAKQPRDTTQTPTQDKGGQADKPDRDADAFFKLTSFRLPFTGANEKA